MPTVLPPAREELSAPYPNPTNAVARIGQGKWWDYVTNLLGLAGTDVGARAALGVAESQLANYFVNGGCQVAQIAAVNLSTTPQYGAVDNVMAWASGGAVSAGTIAQNTSSGIGTTGNSFKLSGVTLTGAGVLSVRIRIESKDAVKYKNIASSVAALVSHDVGSSINYTVIVRKPTVADNYASTTIISTSSATSVPTGISSATWLKSENIAMGDCSLGIEVEFQIACGAITTKNFEFTEFQVARGATAVAIPLKEYDDELRRCKRYCRKSYSTDTMPGAATAVGSVTLGGSSDNASNFAIPVFLGDSMFGAPTITFYTTGGTLGSWTYRRSAVADTVVAVTAFASSTELFNVIVPVGAAYVPCTAFGHYLALSRL